MKRRKKLSRFTIRSKYLFLLLSFLCVVLLVVSYRYEKQFDSFREAVASLFVPVQKGIDTVEQFVEDKVQYFSDMSDLLAERDSLREEVSELQAENAILLQEKEELEQLRALYELDQTYGDYPKVAARVISDTTSNWYSSFLIDKGSEAGMAVGMNVISGNGLVGIVTQVGKRYSRVRSIIDDESFVSGTLSRCEKTCMVQGNLTLREEGTLQLDVSMIDPEADIAAGDEVVTSSISDQYLPGILVGYLTDFEMDASHMTLSGHVTPAVDFSSLQSVLVITTLRDAEEMTDMLEEND